MWHSVGTFVGGHMARIKYTVNAEYQNSRYVNYNRWSEHPEIVGLVDEIMSNFTASRKKAGYMDNMRVLVLDLFESYCADPEQHIEYERNNNHFTFKRDKDSRYTVNDLITAKNFVGAVDHLIDNGYVTNSTGRHFTDDDGNEYGFLSKMRPTEKFAEICSRYKLSLEMVCKKSDEELVRLRFPKVKRDKKLSLADDVAFKNSGKPFPYEDTAETERMRTVTRVYNLLMDNTYIDLDVECLSYADRGTLIEKLDSHAVDDPEIVLRLADKNVYRVFNNADTTFRHGGRFYGAWWIGCPSILRKYITIDGSPTVELDYSGIHIHLAYALEGINYASLKIDPYTLDDNVPDDIPDNVPNKEKLKRKLNKKILLTAINADGEHSTASSVFNELRKDGELKKYHVWSHHPIKSKLDLLTQKHEPIKDYIASNKGILLQYFDSMILELLIDHFTSRGIPILTIHDSVICKVEHQSIVTDQMYELFANMVNNQLRAEAVKSLDEKHPLHIKYQRPTVSVPNWQVSAKSDYDIISDNAPREAIPNELTDNLVVTDKMLEYFLRVDELITVDQKAIRTHRCNCRCNTHKRYLRHLLKRNPRNMNIKIKLIQCDSMPSDLDICNGH
jgi:hypothetical protein